MDPYHLILLFSLLLVFSGFFSATETAFSSINKIKLKHLSQEGRKSALLVLKIVENYEQLLTTVLIGNNIVNILASSLATLFFVGYFGNLGVTISTTITTILILIFAEISPKTLAKETPEKFAMFCCWPIKFIMFLFTPFNILSSIWRKIIIKIFHVHSDNKVTEAELLTIVEEVRQEGGINEGEEQMIRTAIEFDDLSAHEILTPRVDITAVSISDSVESIERCFFETGYSRLPIYKESIDNIIGLILSKDFTYKIMKNHEQLDSIIKPVIFVNEVVKIKKLLKMLQEGKTHLAIVLDEYGGTAGIITLEDIIEELVGEIWDEHDEAMEDIVSISEQSYRIRGNTSLKDFFEIIDDNNSSYNASTVGGWISEYLEEIPIVGHKFTFNNYTVEVTKIKNNRIMEIIVTQNNE